MNAKMNQLKPSGSLTVFKCMSVPPKIVQMIGCRCQNFILQLKLVGQNRTFGCDPTALKGRESVYRVKNDNFRSTSNTDDKIDFFDCRRQTRFLDSRHRKMIGSKDPRYVFDLTILKSFSIVKFHKNGFEI